MARVVVTRPADDHGAPGLAGGRPFVEARVVEVLKGAATLETVRFVQHGHGVAEFVEGQEHLAFLQAIGRSRELSKLGEDSAIHFVSLQEHDDAFPLAGPKRGPTLEAASAFVVAGRAATPAARDAALQAGTRVLLESRDERLAASAIRDIVASPGLALVAPSDAPALLAIVDDETAPVAVRVALLRALEARGVADGDERWTLLLADEAAPPDLVVAIRAAAASPSAGPRARLIALVAHPDPVVAAAAAATVVWPGDPAAVQALSSALSHEAPRVRQAAIRGLDRMATPEALALLGQAASEDEDPRTRRLAAAAARRER